MACFRAGADGIVLTVRLTPRGHHDGLDGVGVLADGTEVALLRVRAAPDSGAANAALVALVANLLGRPKSAVTIVRGATQRVKQVAIEGDAATLAATVSGWARVG
ncbi:MAG TPA: DUF167 family protein [Bauldia sp.]|nr:DUF167 family protein [Bauldia sp.]